jgi:AcrR family transcriptional regulator
MTRERKPSNQELRTRKDLLLAAGRLIREGRKPTMDEVAQEALVSRATAYRHFPSVDALLVEVPVDAAMIDPEEMFAGDASEDAEARVERAEASIHEVVYRNEAQLRIILANSIGRGLEQNGPTRQNRRQPLIEAALATTRERFSDEDYHKLCAALALIFGPESMIVFRDVLGMDEHAAREVKSWAVRALVRAALESSRSRSTHEPSRSTHG